MVQLVAQLGSLDIRRRDIALQELSAVRNEVETLAQLLWDSFGVVSSLLREMCSIYGRLSPPTLTMVESERIGHALVLFQFLVTHQATRIQFVKANLASYVYPFIGAMEKTRPVEHLRLTALSVIGTLVKSGELEVIHYILKTEIMPECLNSIAKGCDLSKTVESLLNRQRWRLLSRISVELGGNNKCVLVATYILQKILAVDEGLNYVCCVADRFTAVGNVLAQLINNVTEKPSPELLKNVIRCYLYLTNNPRARDALCRCLPDMLRDVTFLASVEEDPKTMKWLLQLLMIVGTNQGSEPGSSSGV